MSGRPFWKSAKIGLFRPFSAFFALFQRVRRAPGKSRKRMKKAFFLRYPQICLDPHLLNPYLRHSKNYHLQTLGLLVCNLLHRNSTCLDSLWDVNFQETFSYFWEFPKLVVSGVNKSARERRGRQNLSPKSPL